MRLVLLLFCLQFLVSARALAADPKDVLIGGRPAVAADWPASLYISSGNARCSATLVGERVVLTAAHCMKDEASITFTVGPNKYTAKCNHHAAYKGNPTADWALCLTNRAVSGVPYDSVLTDAALLKVRSGVLLSGYGCTEKGGTGGNDGVFRIGEAKVTKLPEGTTYDTVLGSGAALCFGDSGGAGWVYFGSGKIQRAQFGVNSRGNISTTSYLSSTFVPAAVQFFTTWGATNGVTICGVHQAAQGCRNGAPPPPPPPPKPSPSPCPKK